MKQIRSDVNEFRFLVNEFATGVNGFGPKVNQLTGAKSLHLDAVNAGGVAEISRWCQPPDPIPTHDRAPAGAREYAAGDSRRPVRGGFHAQREPVVGTTG